MWNAINCGLWFGMPDAHDKSGRGGSGFSLLAVLVRFIPRQRTSIGTVRSLPLGDSLFRAARISGCRSRALAMAAGEFRKGIRVKR